MQMRILRKSRLLSLGAGFSVIVLIASVVLGSLWPRREVQAAIAYRSSATACNATANTSVNVPSGTVDGDVMIMVINSKTTASQTAPAGWTPLGPQLNNGSSLSTSIFYRVANNEPPSYTPTTTAVSHCLGIASFSGVDNSNPINASSQRANSTSSIIRANAITPTLANIQVIFISGYGNDVTHSSYSGTNPTFAEHFDARTSAGTDNAIALASGLKYGNESTGDRTARASNGAPAVNNGFLIALAPAPPLNWGLVETFEALGTDNIYDQTLVGPGNVLNPDFPNSSIGSPAGWGNESLNVEIGTEHGAAVYIKSDALGNRNGLRTHAKVMVDYEGLGNGQGISILVAKPEGDPLGSVATWRMYLWKNNNQLIFLLVLGDISQWDGSTIPSSNPYFRVVGYPITADNIQLDVVYDHLVVYDIKNRIVEWYVNSGQVLSEAMPTTYPDSIAHKVIGSSGSSNGRNTRYFIDNIEWIEVP